MCWLTASGYTGTYSFVIIIYNIVDNYSPEYYYLAEYYYYLAEYEYCAIRPV